jgi:hypothetical protein
MTYAEAFNTAVVINARDLELVRIYKIDGMYWATTMCASPHSQAVLVGEVRRMCKR